jgi:protein-tyrosine phosphatase
MAAAILQRELAQRGVAANVHSAGTHAVQQARATRDAVDAMHAEQLDISAHRSEPVRAEDLYKADIILTMTRAQLRELATRSPTAFPRLFTLKELARRARENDVRATETIAEWVARVGAGRRASDLLGDDARDDVEDPIGRSRDFYLTIVQQLTDAVLEIARAGWPNL